MSMPYDFLRLSETIFDDLRRHAELFERERLLRRLEQTHLHLLAVERRHRGNADVDLLAAKLVAEPPVLRREVLVDLEPREQLDARDDPRMHRLRDVHHLVENAVDAIADERGLLQDLDMDVRRARGERVGKDVVHDADDGQIARRFLRASFDWLTSDARTFSSMIFLKSCPSS